MACPKRRVSRTNAHHRRSAWKATDPDLVPISINGEHYRVPRHLIGAVMDGLIDPVTGRPTDNRRGS